MALTGVHNTGDVGHVADHNLIDVALAAKLDTATASGTYVPFAGATNGTSTHGPLLLLTTGAPGNGYRFEIQKTDAPLNYGADTRAAFVVQQKDTQALAASALVPAVEFDLTATGDGDVTAGTHTSRSIWQGVNTIMRKSGDGSGQCNTVTGELRAVGAGGYNELGGFQGTITNFASTNGTLSGGEFVLKDSPDAGVTSFDTQMCAWIGRLAKYSVTRNRRTDAFLGSSEGLQAPDALLAVNGTPAAPNAWVTGVDLSGASFTSGVAIILPNATTLSALDSGLVSRPLLGLTSGNITYMRPGASAASIDLQKYDGTTALNISGSTGKAIIDSTASNVIQIKASGTQVFTMKNDGQMVFNAAITSATVGAAGGAAAMPTPVGYLFINVGASQFKVPYCNV